MPQAEAPSTKRAFSRTSPAANLELIAQAAWAYYHDGMKQSDIAAQLGVSRASVVSYLAEARARGYVRVTLHPDVFAEHQLAQELTDAYGLQSALVAPTGASQANALGRVAKMAADWLPSLLRSGDRLGVSWGQTIFEVAEAASLTPIDGLTVVQLVGTQSTPLGFAAETCSANLARQFQAECINLHAPLVLSSAELARQLAAEPVIARQLRAVAGCNKTIFAAGSCAIDCHAVASGVVTPEQLGDYLAKGAAAVVCGRFIDETGDPIRGEIDAQMIGVTLDDMRGKEMSLLVASGLDRAAPACAAIRGGYATHLATSVDVARALLDMAD